MVMMNTADKPRGNSLSGEPAMLLWFGRSVVSDSLWPNGLQHARLPYPPSSRVFSNLCTLSQWCHPIISSSVAPFSSCPQSFPASESFLMSWLLPSGGQSIGASASASVLLMNIQGWFPLGSTGLISLQSKGLSRVRQHHSLKASILHCSAFFMVQNVDHMVQLSHLYMTTGKTIALTIWTFVRKVISLLFNTLSRFAIVFLPRSKHLVISWLWLLSTVIFGARENKVCHCFHFSSIYLPWSDGTGHHGFLFLNVEFQTSFFLSPLSPSSIGPLVSLHFLS